MIRTVTATRYVTPLREGGSLPAIVEADDDGMYVLKFRGAGQGPKALIAELVAGELARSLGLPVPEIVFVELDAALARAEPDYEIQSLVNSSAGLNLALDYLPGALAFDPPGIGRVAAELASAVVWFDAYVTNVDRTPRNTNMLWWHRKLWLIDHGASLYFHHTWDDYLARSRQPFRAIRDHALLPAASMLHDVDERLSERISAPVLETILGAIPDDWLDDPAFDTPQANRHAYQEYLLARIQSPRAFVEEAIGARAQLV